MEIAGTEGHALSVLDGARTGLWEGQPRPSGVSGTGPRGRRSHTTRAVIPVGGSSLSQTRWPDGVTVNQQRGRALVKAGRRATGKGGRAGGSRGGVLAQGRGSAVLTQEGQVLA